MTRRFCATGIAFVALFVLSACVGVNTYPTIARAGGTVTVMVGGTEKARKETVDVSLTDATSQVWNLKTMGLVRSVFNLRTDGNAYGAHYSSYLDSYISWAVGHEPMQTVLVADLPATAAVGPATMTINTHVNDDSSGITSPFTVNLEIIPGAGSSDQFQRRDFGSGQPVDFSRLEPAPHAKIGFGGSAAIGAASLTISFNTAVLNPDDINVYVPESTVRGSFSIPGAFGATQRMVYWRQDGTRLYVDIVAPQGIEPKYLQLYLTHPRGLSGPVNFAVTGAAVYDVNGNVMAVQPGLEYFP